MTHNFITDVRTGGDFLKSYWAKWSREFLVFEKEIRTVPPHLIGKRFGSHLSTRANVSWIGFCRTVFPLRGPHKTTDLHHPVLHKCLKFLVHSPNPPQSNLIAKYKIDVQCSFKSCQDSTDQAWGNSRFGRDKLGEDSSSVSLTRK